MSGALILLPLLAVVAEKKTSQALKFSLFMFMLVLIAIFLYVFFEYWGKRALRTKFKKFIESHQMPDADMRAMPRVSVPEALKVEMVLKDPEFGNLKAHVTDISMAGFGLTAASHLKKISLNQTLRNTQVLTPLGPFTVKEIKAVRSEANLNGHRLGIQIVAIDEEHFQQMSAFVIYLKEFLYHAI